MTQAKKVGVWQWIIAYALWAVVGALLLAIIWLVRSAMQQWFAVLQISRWSWWASHQFFVYFAGAVWIFLIFYIEGYFRDGLFKGDLRRRALKVYRPVVIVVLVALLALAGVDIYVRWNL